MNYEENQINEPLEVYAGKVHFPIPHAGCMIGHIEAPYRDLDLKEVTDPTDGSKQFMLRIEKTGKHESGKDHMQKVIYCY